ncbi:MAG: TRAP transporter substrate-binding protein DctP [Ruminococcaceae bacterium]|nr:TRAP transporter substrate-binding protein DctP [Oscillospiraceae bacterium]
MKKLLVLCLCILLVFPFAACGNSTSAAPGGASAAASTPDAGTPPASEPAAPAGAVEPGSKGSFEFIIGAGHSPTGFAYVSCASDAFEPEVIKRAAELGYTVSFTEGFGGTIAPLADVLEATETGLLDIGLMAAVFEPVKAQVLNYTNYMPFGIPEIDKTYQVAKKVYQANQEAIDNHFEGFNVKILGLGGASASYHIISQWEIKGVDDLKGHKIAAAGANLGLLSNTGGVGVQSNLNEAYTSLQTGVYESWIIYANGAAGYKLYEVAPYYLKADFGCTAATAMIMNMDKWNTLPEDLQQVMLDVGFEVYGPACVARAQEEEKLAFEMMEENGTTITQITDEEREKWVNLIDDPAVTAIEELEAAGLPGKKIFTEFYEFAAEVGYDAPRRFGQPE